MFMPLPINKFYKQQFCCNYLLKGPEVPDEELWTEADHYTLRAGGVISQTSSGWFPTLAGLAS